MDAPKSIYKKGSTNYRTIALIIMRCILLLAGCALLATFVHCTGNLFLVELFVCISWGCLYTLKFKHALVGIHINCLLCMCYTKFVCVFGCFFGCCFFWGCCVFLKFCVCVFSVIYIYIYIYIYIILFHRIPVTTITCLQPGVTLKGRGST